ncbi:MAG TPA: AAA family ATPase [Blastocatellia bacterium]|nr:AAA family ATPase [Blastocatellia bacterium]
MIILINGSFGVGKTTVARLLQRSIRRSIIFDPEWFGWLIKYAPTWMRLAGSGTDDYQDIALWRRSVVAGARLFRAMARGPVIIPMAFSRRDYFDQIVAEILRFDKEVKVYCLQAELTTILRRLELRDANRDPQQREWALKKVRECVDSHRDDHFGEPIDTENSDAAQVAVEILSRIRKPQCDSN